MKKLDTVEPAIDDQPPAVILLEYGDYQCPYCRQAHYFIQRILAEHSIKFVFRHFPLKSIHPHAMAAAKAAEASANQDRFWQMHDLIFENAHHLAEADLFFRLAKQLELNQKMFLEDFESEQTKNRIDDDFESGVFKGVNGTPTFFLNDKRIASYDGTYESLLNAVTEVLENKG